MIKNEFMTVYDRGVTPVEIAVSVFSILLLVVLKKGAIS